MTPEQADDLARATAAILRVGSPYDYRQVLYQVMSLADVQPTPSRVVEVAGIIQTLGIV